MQIHITFVVILNFHKRMWQLLMILGINVVYILKAKDLMRPHNNNTYKEERFQSSNVVLYDAMRRRHYNFKSAIESIAPFTVN